MDSSESLNWICEQMIRIEENWTKQIQDQQTRINSVMAVNGFLLAFLAATGFGVAKDIGKGWYLYPYYISLVLLCIALLFGLGAFIPRTRIADRKDDYWLDSHAIWDQYVRDPQKVGPEQNVTDIIREVAGSAGANQDWNKKLRDSLKWRRSCLYGQVAFLALATLSLVVAIAAIAYKVIPS